jgi:lysophospholipase L1-like esterase
MLIFKNNYFKLLKRKNKPKNYIRYFFYFFVFLFCISATSLCSCSNIIKKAEKIASGIPFNYPGLRIETRSIRFEDIKNNYPRIVCFGDSVTFGWNVPYGFSYPYILEKNLASKYPGVIVINCGVGGNTIADASSRLKKDVLSYKPHLVIINFGLNDGMLKKVAGGISPATESESLYYKKDSSYFFPQVNITDFDIKYKEIINLLKENNIRALVLGMSPVTDDFPVDREADFKKKQKEIYSVYNDRIKETASDNMVDFLNIWEIYNSKEDLNKYIQTDAIHPDKAGMELISESLYNYIIENGILNYSDSGQS